MMNELVRGIKINIIGNLFRFSRFGFIVLAAVLYGTELFGVYTVAWATAEILNRFGLLGLEHGLLFELAHFKKTGESRKLYQKITSSLKACLIVSLLGSIGLVIYTFLWVDVTLVRHSVFILAPLIPLYNIGILLIQATMGLKEMKYNAIIRSGCEPLSLLLGLFVFLKTPLQEYGIILSQALSLFLVFILGIWAFSRCFSWREVGRTWLRPARYMAIVRYSLPMYIIEVVDALLFRIDIFFISGVLGTGSPDQMKFLGVYGFAKQIARVLTQTKNAFAPIFVPVSSESYLQRDSNNLWSQVRYSTQQLLLLNIPLAIFLSAFGLEILRVVGKDAGLLSFGTYAWLLWGQFAYSTFSVVMFFLVTTQKSRVFLLAEIVLMGLLAVAGPAMTRMWGAWGAAMATGIVYGLISTLACSEALRIHRKNFFSRRSLRIVLAGICSGVLVYLLHRFWPFAWHTTLTNLATVVAGLLLYFVLTTTRSQWRNLYRW